MRTIPTLLLLTVLITGCASGPGFSGVRPDPSGANAVVNPVAGEFDDGVSRAQKRSVTNTTVSAMAAAAVHRTGRVIKCAAVGAGFGFIATAQLAKLTGGLGAYLLPITVPAGLVMGVGEAFNDNGPDSCVFDPEMRPAAPNPPKSAIKVQRGHQED